MTAKQSRKVLLVEDNPSMGSLLADMVGVFAIPCVQATNGEEALGMLESENIAMVISDLRMPRMTGTELLVAVKEKNPSMPVVLISGFSLEASDDETVSAKADDFLTKPFRMNDIKSILERHYRP